MSYLYGDSFSILSLLGHEIFGYTGVLLICMGIAILWEKCSALIKKKEKAEDNIQKLLSIFNLYAKVRDACIISFFINIALAAIYAVVDERHGIHFLQDPLVPAHIGWSLLYFIGTLYCEVKVLQNKKDDEMTDKLLGSILKYLCAVTDNKNAVKFTKFACELIDKTGEPEEMALFIRDIYVSPDSEIELGKKSLCHILYSFLHPNHGASGWFALTEDGKTTLKELQTIMDEK